MLCPGNMLYKTSFRIEVYQLNYLPGILSWWLSVITQDVIPSAAEGSILLPYKIRIPQFIAMTNHPLSVIAMNCHPERMRGIRSP